MKLVEKFRYHLLDSYQDVHVIDEKGDGHFIQVICIDNNFEGMNLLKKSREILKYLDDLQGLVHALSVKGFTEKEWDDIKNDYTLVKYDHIPSSTI